MKISFLAPADSIHSYRWIKFFADRGHEIQWFSFSPLTFEPLPNVEFLLLPNPMKGLSSLIRSITDLRRYLKIFSPAVFHIHSAGTYGFIGSFSSEVPIVLTAWGSDIVYAGKHWLKGPLVKRILRKATLITCDAHHMVDAMETLGAPRDKIQIINFGIDTNRFRPMGKNSQIRERFKLGSSPVVVSLRNFEPVYDIATLLHAIPKVLAKVPDAKFLIVGRGTLEQELKRLAVELKIEHAAQFVGFVPNHELPEFLSSMDIYVSTSLSDGGIAASTAEAMACGLPVLVTDSGDNRLWIEEGKNGRIIPTQSPDLLAARLIELIGSTDQLKSIGSAARKTIEEKNSYSVEMEKMNREYERFSASAAP